MSLFDTLLLDPYRDPKLVYIALRDDNAKGSGTIADPFNGASLPYPAVDVYSLEHSVAGGQHIGTVMTTEDHGFVTGDYVSIAFVNLNFTKQDNCSYVGTFAITRTSETSFTYVMKGPPFESPASPLAGHDRIQCWREREQFDVVMRSIGSNSLINICEGVFETKGSNPFIAGGWEVKSGQRILGSGMGVTTLKIVGTAGAHIRGGLTHAVGMQTGTAEGFEVSDLTVDCNVEKQLHPEASCAAVGLNHGGHHVRIRRVRAIHFGSLGLLGDFSAYLENFVFTISNGSVVDVVIEDCIAEFPSPNIAWNSTLLLVGGSGNDVQSLYGRGGVLRNNYLNGEIVYGAKAWLSDGHFTSDGGGLDSGIVEINTKTPHGYTTPGNVSVQGVRVGGSTNNRFNGVFKIEEVGPPYGLKFLVFVTDSSLGEVAGDSPDFSGAFIGAPVSPQPIIMAWVSDVDDQTFHVKTSIPHNLTLNNRALIQGIYLNGMRPDNPDNPGNGALLVTEVISKTEFLYRARAALSGSISISVDNPSVGGGHDFLTADGGTGAVVEGNRLFHGAVGGPWVDTGSTLDLVARNNYYHDFGAGPSQSLGGAFDGRSVIPPPGLIALTRDDTDHTVAICNAGSGHGLVTGQVVLMSNITVDGHAENDYIGSNAGYQIVKSVTETAFSYQMESDPGADADVSSTPKFRPIAQSSNRTMENNIIELGLGPVQHYWFQPTGLGMGIVSTLADLIPYAFRRSVVRGNLIRQMNWQTEGSHTAITIRNAEKVLVDKNILDVGYPYPLSFKKVMAPAYADNRTPAGQLIRGYNEGTQGNSSELQTLIDDVFLMCL